MEIRMRFIELTRCGGTRAVVNSGMITHMVEYEDFTAVHIGLAVLEVTQTIEEILKQING